MATIVFYEKPGCINNTRQKAILAEAGHDVVALDIRVQPWTPDGLRPFFGDRPVAEWFNRAAPRVKSGAVIPELMEEAESLAAMCLDPLLIRRPLMECDGRRTVGFDERAVEEWLAPATKVPSESCPQTGGVCP
jgi:nitrogenase-associated protein